MAFTKLNQPNSVNKLGECIASLYHVSQGHHLDKFKQLCFNLIHQFIPLGQSYWIVEHNTSNTEFFSFACKQNNTQHNTFFIEKPDYSGADRITQHIKINSCNIQHIFYLTPKNTAHGFTAKNQVDLNYILTHLIEAYRLNTLSSFQKHWHKYPHGNAIFDQEGRVIELDDNFKHLALLPNIIYKQLSLESLVCQQQYFFVKNNQLFEVQKVVDTYFIRVCNFSGNFSALSNKEKEICFFLVQACSNKGIADALQVSAKTIENHLANIYLKTGIQSRAKLTSALFNGCRDN